MDVEMTNGPVYGCLMYSPIANINKSHNLKCEFFMCWVEFREFIKGYCHSQVDHQK